MLKLEMRTIHTTKSEVSEVRLYQNSGTNFPPIGTFNDTRFIIMLAMYMYMYVPMCQMGENITKNITYS